MLVFLIYPLLTLLYFSLLLLGKSILLTYTKLLDISETLEILILLQITLFNSTCPSKITALLQKSILLYDVSIIKLLLACILNNLSPYSLNRLSSLKFLELQLMQLR